MTQAEAALRIFARAHRLRVTTCNVYNANLGERALRQTRMFRRDLRVTLRAAASLIEAELPLSDRAIAFAVNHPDLICMFQRPVHGLDGVMPWPVFVPDQTAADAVRDWVREGTHSQLLIALHLTPRESLQVYVNGIVAVVEPTRHLPELVEALVVLGEHLPAAPGRDALVSELAVELPEDLRSVTRFFARWAVADDAERSERISRSRPAQRAQLRRAVEPLLPRIHAYLASLREPLPASALRLSYLAELVAELRDSEA